MGSFLTAALDTAQNSSSFIFLPQEGLAWWYQQLNIPYYTKLHYFVIYSFNNYLCLRKSKSEDNAIQISKKGFKKILSKSGVTTCWKRHDNNVMTATFGFCLRPEVVSDEVLTQEIPISEMYVFGDYRKIPAFGPLTSCWYFPVLPSSRLCTDSTVRQQTQYLPQLLYYEPP